MVRDKKTKMSESYSLVKNSLGFFEIEPKPSLTQLESHYEKKYFQNKNGRFKKTYTEQELKYFSVEAELALKTVNRYAYDIKKYLLDLGCGEGFFSQHCINHGWHVRCVDFSNEGISHHNPDLIPYFTQEDVLSYLEKSSIQFDKVGLFNLDNVLEHVLDPIALIRSLKDVMSKTAVARIEVPNDFSKFQFLLTQLNCTEQTWIDPPEHLNYFNKDSLKKTLTCGGLELISLQADFPVEQFLLN